MARKILLADDSVAVQRAIEATLEPKDFEVLSVSRGSDVIREAKKSHPDVILIDGDLADLNGYEVCRRVKEDPELMGIPVILMVSEEDPQRARAVGAEAELAKPFKGEDLLQQVMAVVDLSVEPTVKIDTSELEEFDLGEGISEELDLGELDLDEGVIELTEEMGSLEGLEDTEEASLEGLEDFEVAPAREAASKMAAVKTEEFEEISFEEDIEELDLGELELEGTEELVSLEEDLAAAPDKGLMATDEVEIGVDLDQQLSLLGEREGDLLEGEAEGEEVLLDTDEVEAGLAPEGLIDTGELEGWELEGRGAERISSGQLEEDLGETSIEFEELTDSEMVFSRELAMKEEVGAEEGSVTELSETELEWEEEVVPFERGPRPPLAASIGRDAEIPGIHGVSPSEGIVASFGGLEEVSLEEEFAQEKPVGGVEEAIAFVKLEEIPLEEIPLLEERQGLEISEEDLGIVSPFSEEGLRREIVKNLQLVAERILSELAPPIVEKVAREIALEKAERIIMEEIERLKSGQ